MSFAKIVEEYTNFEINEFLGEVNSNDVERVLNKDYLSHLDFLTLLSPQAVNYLEDMAKKAYQITRQHFGKTMVLFTPMYLANYCTNKCLYCGYNFDNKIKRKKLSLDEVEAEAKNIAATGLKHILILTGESRKKSSVEYMVQCVKVLKQYFDSISIEVYPLEVEEYANLREAGVSSLSLYQETYNKSLYNDLHLAGPKKDYYYRLDGPERGCQAKLPAVNIGALLGLAPWQEDAFYTGLHLEYLQKKYLDTEISVSVPRMRPHAGGFDTGIRVSDQDLVQIILAYRLFMPRVGITLTTRERAELRDNLIPLGITKMSAGVSTEVGGHSGDDDKGEAQFIISDGRSVDEISHILYTKGFQPVFKDWETV